MADPSVEKVLDQWQAEYRLLLEEATELMRIFDTVGSGGANELLVRRQQIIDGLENLPARLQKLAVEADASENPLIEEFRTFQEEITAKILKLDALALALGKERLHSLRRELAGLTKRKSVFTAYEEGSSIGGRRGRSVGGDRQPKH